MHLNQLSRAVTVSLLYTLSGITSLSYEVLWARMFAILFGVSIFGVVVSVAAFMAGLGLGSILGARFSHRVSRPLLWFGLLEGSVAAYALTTPWLLHASETGLAFLAPHKGLQAWYLVQGSAAFALLLLPALAMGAAFAFVLQAVSSSQVSLGRLYGLNACGGAIGALLPLWLLPVMGWSTGLEIIAALGSIIALLSLLLSRRTETSKSRQHRHSDSHSRPASAMLLAYAGIGAAALILEVGWTRLFGMVMLRTEYVLAVILAVFVLGIGLGSLSAKLLARRFSAPSLLALLPAASAVFALLTLWCLPLISAWVETASFDSLFGALFWQALALAAVTLPVTLAFGAWLPLLSAQYGDARQTGAWLYGANSVGAAIGAILAGVVLLPLLGVAGTVCAAGFLLFVAGTMLAPVMQSARSGVALIILVALAWPVHSLPPVQALLPQEQNGAQDVYRYEDAVSINHVIERPDGQRILLTDLQRMDAASDQASVAAQENQARLPLLLHPEPRSVLFLGVGTGISLAGSLAFPGLARHAVELSQGAITAAHTWFSPVNDGVMSQVEVSRDDVRRFLRASTQSFDVIIGDLFHPDLAGHSSLLSIQQFARARARLTPDGLFVQWLALNQFDAESLAVVLRSFQRVFPNAVIFMDGFRLALVGPQNQLQGAPALTANLQRLSPAVRDAATGGEGPWTWLGRYWGKISASQGPLQDEWAPHIEFGLPRARYRGDLDLSSLLKSLLQTRPSLEQAVRELNIAPPDQAAFERAFSASELAARGWLATLQGDQDGARLMRLAYQANPQDRWISFALADSMYATLPQAMSHGIREKDALLTILGVRPDHADVLRALWHLERAAGNDGQAAIYRTRLQAASPLDSEVRTLHPELDKQKGQF